MFVDGFLLAVPTKNKSEYLELAQSMAEVFIDNGALEVVENWGSEVPDGELTSFIKAVQCGDDETVVFSWIIWPSKELRDEGMEACLAHPLFSDETWSPPFDGKRMIFGSFEQILKVSQPRH
jgi:uncharacterized protein YbaA (DUF1428 family)